MKKLFFASVLTLGLSWQAEARIVISTAGGGECGYRHVSESHEDGRDALSCVDPGYCDCFFHERLTQTPPHATAEPSDINASLSQIYAMVNALVADGNISGTFSSELGLVSWSVTDSGIKYEID